MLFRKPYLPVIFLLLACGHPKKSETTVPKNTEAKAGSFGYDVDFLKKHKDVIVLGGTGSRSQVLIVNDYQARVMTSTSGGDKGNSYGWINFGLIGSGKILPHMNAFGGEDRFWLGPEGGQFALYFKKGAPFDFTNWQTPALIDTDPFDLVSFDSLKASFRKNASLTNYAGFRFDFEIRRRIKILSPADIQNEFGISGDRVRSVAYESLNEVINTGKNWSRKTGLISIWILGMFTPTDKTVIVVPHERSIPSDPRITDNYFGAIPPDRITRNDQFLLLRADGRARGKIGIAPSLAKNVAGSYSADTHVLTLIKFDLDKDAAYVNSKWEVQKEPYGGDAVNAYNDGPVADGTQMGPFYELESSSPAKELKTGDTLTHRRITLHLEGDEVELNKIAKKILGVSLADIIK